MNESKETGNTSCFGRIEQAFRRIYRLYTEDIPPPIGDKQVTYYASMKIKSGEVMWLE